MSASGWTQIESPFHQGETTIQSRLGVQAQAERQGRRMIRDYLIEQHRQFFAQLPYIAVGTVESSGYPWASLLVGPSGFLSTPDQHTLRVETTILPGDPLHNTLAVGSDIGFLGIDLKTRRRNRLNGVVSTIKQTGFDVQVKQSFGNCPQYIQARKLLAQQSRHSQANEDQEKVVHHIKNLSTAEQALISTADTFFIATAYQDTDRSLSSGVDVSHRGGKPGFVRISDNNTLTVPDYSGNRHFNTLGNIILNPKAGLLFLDFERGDLLYVTGRAEIIWEGPEIKSYVGAERLLRFHLKQGFRVDKSLSLRWSAPEFSPYLDNIDRNTAAR